MTTSTEFATKTETHLVGAGSAFDRRNYVAEITSWDGVNMGRTFVDGAVVAADPRDRFAPGAELPFGKMGAVAHLIPAQDGIYETQTYWIHPSGKSEKDSKSRSYFAVECGVVRELDGGELYEVLDEKYDEE